MERARRAVSMEALTTCRITRNVDQRVPNTAKLKPKPVVPPRPMIPLPKRPTPHAIRIQHHHQEKPQTQTRLTVPAPRVSTRSSLQRTDQDSPRRRNRAASGPMVKPRSKKVAPEKPPRPAVLFIRDGHRTDTFPSPQFESNRLQKRVASLQTLTSVRDADRNPRAVNARESWDTRVSEFQKQNKSRRLGFVPSTQYKVATMTQGTLYHQNDSISKPLFALKPSLHGTAACREFPKSPTRLRPKPVRPPPPQRKPRTRAPSLPLSIEDNVIRPYAVIHREDLERTLAGITTQTNGNFDTHSYAILQGENSNGMEIPIRQNSRMYMPLLQSTLEENGGVHNTIEFDEVTVDHVIITVSTPAYTRPKPKVKKRVCIYPSGSDSEGDDDESKPIYINVQPRTLSDPGIYTSLVATTAQEASLYQEVKPRNPL